MSNGRNSSSSFKGLPPLPPVSTAATGAPTSEFGQRPSSSSKRTSIFGNLGNSLVNSANRLSMQSKRASNVPRPTPIPIPQPVTVSVPTSAQPPVPIFGNEGSAEGPSSSSSSTGSALASVSAELVQHASVPSGMHSHSSSISPSSPRETNGLLAEGYMTPTRSPIPRIPTTSSPPAGARPYSAVESSSSRPIASNYDSGNRPHSSADAWSMPDPNNAHVSPALHSQSPSVDSLLRPGQLPRARSTNNFPSNTPSPLNPNVLPLAGARPPHPGSTSSRPGSMVLYRLAGIGDDFNPQMSSLSPPVTTNSRRASRFSTLSSANSSYSIFSDSKYPVPAREDGSLTPPPSGAFLAYEYDPSADQDAPDDADDALHRPDEPGKKERMGGFNTRGMFNVLLLILIPLGLITLFVLYPVVSHFDHNAQSALLTGNDNTNTPDNNGGTSSNVRTADQLIDPDTADSAKTWTNPVDGSTYNLVFSDEFKTNGRSFGAGEDPFWQAVDLQDTKSNDLNWYSSDHVTTKGGRLVITLEQKPNNTFAYTSGMLQSWNNMCFTGGYVEVSVSLPGSSTNAGYTPQVYTMGNLARSGYAASEYGVYPYTYDTCDTNVGAGTVLPGQRLSACTCQSSYANGDHPGPQGTATFVRGRGAPQIDLLNYADQGQDTGVVSQGIRFAPFSTNPARTTGTTIESATDSQVNPYTGGDSVELLGVLTNVSQTSYQAGGGELSTFGYVLNPDNTNPTAAALHWIKGGNTEVYRIAGTALAASTNGDMGQRLITQEPMYLVLALSLSQAAQNIQVGSLTFPAQLVVDYVRVYQPNGQDPNVSCDPTNMPTAKYIQKHSNAYQDATLTTWADAGYGVLQSSNAGDC